MEGHTIPVEISSTTYFRGPYLASDLSTMKVTIREWNAVASWRWDMPEDDVCGICRVQFDGTCPTCKYPGDDCTLRESSLKNTYLLNEIHANTVISDWKVRPLLSYGMVLLEFMI